MKNPLFDPNIADPATSPDPFSANPNKDIAGEKTKTKQQEKQEEDPQTFVQYY